MLVPVRRSVLSCPVLSVRACPSVCLCLSVASVVHGARIAQRRVVEARQPATLAALLSSVVVRRLGRGEAAASPARVSLLADLDPRRELEVIIPGGEVADAGAPEAPDGRVVATPARTSLRVGLDARRKPGGEGAEAGAPEVPDGLVVAPDTGRAPAIVVARSRAGPVGAGSGGTAEVTEALRAHAGRTGSARGAAVRTYPAVPVRS